MPAVTATVAAHQPAKKRRLGELLIEAGVLDQARLQAALIEQKKWGGKLGRTLVEMGFLDEQAMVDALSKQLNLPTVDLDGVELPPTVVQLMRVDIAERYGVFPISGDSKSRTIQVATSDPTNFDALQELGFSSGGRVHPVVATASSIDRAIRRYYYGESTFTPVRAEPSQVVSSASIELDVLLGAELPPQPPAPPPAFASQPTPAAAFAALPSAGTEASLKREVLALREQVDSLEKVTASQVRSLKALVELLIESGLISRDEYFAKVHKPG